MSHKVLENRMRAIINSLSAGKEFHLHDIIENPPAQLGRQLYEDVQSGRIANVICITQSNDTVQKYRKI